MIQSVRLVFLLGYFYELTHVTQGFKFFNILEGSIESESKPSCYSDGYMAMNDYVQIIGKFELLDTMNTPPVLHVYRKSDSDNSKNLICIIDLTKNDKGSFPCYYDKYGNTKYWFNFTILVKQDFNHSRLILMPVKKATSWEFLTDLIYVHPAPIFTATLNTLPMELTKCHVHLSVGSDFLVEFCANNLKNPSLDVSWVKEPSPFVGGHCLQRTFHLAVPSEQILLSYVDECGDLGSFTCIIGEQNFVTDILGDPHPYAEESQNTEWSVLLIPAICAALFCVAVCLIALLCSLWKSHKRRHHKHHPNTVPDMVPQGQMPDLGTLTSNQRLARAASSHHSIYPKQSSASVYKSKSGNAFYFAA